MATCRQQADRYVRTFEEPATVNILQEILERSTWGSYGGGKLAVWYDLKTAGESSTQPHLRRPSFNPDRLQKTIKAALAARKLEAVTASLFLIHGNAGPNADVLVLCFDGGRDHNLKLFNCMICPDGSHWPERERQQLTVTYSEESVLARKATQRGFIQLAEGLHVFGSKISVEKRNGRHFQRSTISSVIGPGELPQWKDLWRETSDTKKAIYGHSGKILASGPSPDPKMEKPSFGDEREPVHWHSMPTTVVEEVLHTFQIGVLLDASMADESVGLACLRMKVSYLGMAWTAKHAELLSNRLKQRLWAEFKDQKSPLHQPMLCPSCIT
ncbi:unnamed protein product [Symbiodinium sp. CCMP2592]|nr:unnamed protein product [Symbiodinium sp. CCMP2592]